jgi:PAS domain S-box-containing protein
MAPRTESLPSTDMFRLLYETAPGAFLALAPDRPRFTIVAVSDAYLAATGTSRDIVGRGIFEVFPDDPSDPRSTGKPARNSFERVLDTRSPDTMAVQKHSIRRPESEGGGFEERYWSPLNTPVLGGDGEVLFIHHRVEDVTESVRAKQKTAEQDAVAAALRTRAGEIEVDVLRRALEIQDANRQLRAANARLAELDREREQRVDERVREGVALLQAISDTSPDVLFAKDREGRMMFANPAALALVGKPLEQVIGKTDAEFLDDQIAARQVMENDRRIMERGVPEEVEERVPLADGSERVWLSRKTPYRDRAANVIGLLGTSRDITDRKRAADALRDSEERLRAAHERLRVQVESSPLALVEWDSEYRVVGYSGRAQEMFGFRPDEVLGKRIDEIPWIPEEDWPSVRAVMRDMSSGARPSNVNANRNVRKDGRVIFCEWYNSTLHDEAGRLVSVLSLVLDVTERDRAEAALRTSEQRLRAMFEDAAVGIVEVDREDRFVAVNGRFCDMLGYARDELIGRTLHEITAPDDLAVTRDLNAAGQTGELRAFEYEKRYLRRDGTPVWVHVTVSVVRDEAGRFLRAIGTAEDITQRQHAQDALRESEARLRLALDAARMIAWEFDPATKRVTLTEHASELLQLPGRPHETSDQGYGPIHRQDVERHRALVTQAIEGGSSYVSEYRQLRDGEVVWLEERGRAVTDEAGRTVRLVGVTQNITERKRAEEALRDANERLVEADRRKDEFLGMLSHELRNPLAPIRNSLYILDHAEPTGHQARRAKDVANRQVAHLTRLVDDLLDVTRIARGKVELRRANLDLAALARRTADDYRALMRDRGLDLVVAVPDDPLIVNGDDTRLAQVLGNLLSNAAKFTPAGGQVTLAIQRNGGRAVVHVHDTGVGIAPDLLPTIFDPFTQGKQTLARSEGGLGLGLALVKGLAELHGGRVVVTSEPGSGTEFTVEVPLAVPADSPRRADAARPASRTYRVLVVDDNADAAESLAELVRLFGHEVDVAHDGPSALASVVARRPDIVLCDLGLPGMDGYAVARALRARLDGKVQLVAVSGYAQPEDVKRSAEAGFDAHIAKPPDPARIERLFS